MVRESGAVKTNGSTASVTMLTDSDKKSYNKRSAFVFLYHTLIIMLTTLIMMIMIILIIVIITIIMVTTTLT